MVAFFKVEPTNDDSRGEVVWLPGERTSDSASWRAPRGPGAGSTPKAAMRGR
jgi:hypothetical protein